MSPRPADSRCRCGALILAAALLLLAGAWPLPSVAQIVVETDLGVITVPVLQQMSPSRVFRPIDMIGARAGAAGWAMGGAHVGAVRGIEAISWNPAGLGWLARSEISGDMRLVGSSGTTSGFPDSFRIPAARLSVTRYAVNLKTRIHYGMLGAATSTTLMGRRIAAALSYRRYIDVAYPEEILEDMVQNEVAGNPITIAFDNKEHGGIDAAAASVGLELVPNLVTFGANANLLGGILRSDEQLIVATGGPTGLAGSLKSGSDYSGNSFDLGLQVRWEDLASVGLRYTPGFDLRVRNGTISYRGIPNPESPFVPVVRAKIADYDLNVPPLLSAGISLRPDPRLRAAFDWNRQEWEETKANYTWPGSSPDSLPLRNVNSVHAGLEIRLLKFRRIDLPVRLGYHGGPLSMADLQVLPDSLQGRRAVALDGDEEVKGSAYTIGLGVETGNVRYDLSYEIRDYRFRRFYFDLPYDELINRQSTQVTIDRRATTLRLSATLSL